MSLTGSGERPQTVEQARDAAIVRICDCECTSQFQHSSAVCRTAGITKIDALITAVRSEERETRQALVDALKQVEWTADDSIWSPVCYWCRGYKRQPAMDQDYHAKAGHKPDCPRQAALKLAGEP